MLYPNPSTGVMHLSMPEFAGSAHIVVYNSLGLQVLNMEISENTYLIDLSSQPEGIYVLQVRNTAGLVSTHKIVLMR